MLSLLHSPTLTSIHDHRKKSPPISKLDVASSISHLLSLDSSLSIHHSFLQFFFSLPLPSPRPKHWWFRQFLSHLFHTFSVAHLWIVENTKGSIFSLPSWWSLVSLDVNCDKEYPDLGYISKSGYFLYISSVQRSPVFHSFNKFKSIYWLSHVLGTVSIEVI